MIAALKKLMKENYGIKQINDDDNFKKDYGLTSFDFVNLICLIEEEYHIEIDEKDYRSLNTVSELIAYLEAKSKEVK